VGCGDTCVRGSCGRKKVRYDLAISSDCSVGGTTKDRLARRNFDSEPLTPAKSANLDWVERRA
jgi:hypothetical protein